MIAHVGPVPLEELLMAGTGAGAALMAARAWLGLHLLYLIGFRNRANVLVNWAWNYLTYDRGARLLAEADRELR